MHDVMAAYQVCRYWRQVMKVFPSIWTTIVVPYFDDRHPEALAICGGEQRPLPPGAQLVSHYLALSGSLPLDVYISDPRLLYLFSDQSYRLRQLEVSFPGQTFRLLHTEVIVRTFHLFNHAAPLLEVFDFGAVLPDRDPSHNWNLLEYRGVQLPVIFAGQTPLLRRLRLSGLMRWKDTHFPNLTHICITGYVVTDVDSFANVRDLLKLLQHSPALEELYLSHLESWSVRETYNDIPEIRPLRLRRLSISDCYVLQFALFQYLHVPFGTSVSLTNIGGDDGALTRVLLRHAERLKAAADMKRLEVNYYSDKILAFGPSGSLRIMTAKLEEILPLHELGGISFAQTLEEVWISGRSRSPYYYLWQSNDFDCSVLFTALISLQSLHIRFRSAKSILQALTPWKSQPDITCPNLHTISLTSSLGIDGCLLELLKCAQARFDAGHPLRRILIQPSADGDDFRSETVLAHLREVVDVVEYGVVCPLIEVRSELNEETHHQYWPVWLTGDDHYGTQTQSE
ncbi:hypothetical protein EUX98_g2738 [Antrodiella citrinella]|uniref:F-box domain-containing protein n=1 Tax=Antrodiella citrinella TaxID=2447956 RepID=A0A4S4N137_9APHY|nr:hypothetical protein EUX98_g2738 [Antrodiella citrinella]